MPSVVIGFLIALWLAPIIERWILAFFASLVVVPVTFVVFMAVWQLLRRSHWAKRVENGYEFLVVLPVLLVGVGIAVYLATPLETWFFGGNFRRRRGGRLGHRNAQFREHFRRYAQVAQKRRLMQRSYAPNRTVDVCAFFDQLTNFIRFAALKGEVKRRLGKTPADQKA